MVGILSLGPGPVVATEASPLDRGVVYPGDPAPGARGMAEFTGLGGFNVTVGHVRGTHGSTLVMTGGTFSGDPLEFSTDMAAFTRSPFMPPGQGEPCREMIELKRRFPGRIPRTRRFRPGGGFPLGGPGPGLGVLAGGFPAEQEVGNILPKIGNPIQDSREPDEFLLLRLIRACYAGGEGFRPLDQYGQGGRCHRNLGKKQNPKDHQSWNPGSMFFMRHHFFKEMFHQTHFPANFPGGGGMGIPRIFHAASLTPQADFLEGPGHVAPFATLSKPSSVNIVRLVAGGTCPEQFQIMFHRLGVTGPALKSFMGSIQNKPRLRVVVKFPQIPVIGIMT